MLRDRVGSERRSVVRTFLLLFLVFAYFMPRWADWNIDSRLDLVHAIVDHRTVRIDKVHYNTWDKAVYKGHYYSDKAPGTAVLGAAVYAGFRFAYALPGSGTAIRALERNSAWNVAIDLGRASTQFQPAPKGTTLGGCQRSGSGNVQYIPWGNRLVPPVRDWALSKYAVTVGSVALLSALFGAFFFWFLGFFILSAWKRAVSVALYTLGTTALPYSTNFYSHQLVAAFLFIAFALLLLYSKGAVGGWVLPVSGFLLGLSLFTEYTVAIIIPFIGLYGMWACRARLRKVGAFLAAGSIPLGMLFVYNYLCFGNPFDTGYSHDFCWSSAQAAGIAGFTYPHLGPLFDLTFGPFRGLFYMSPFLLLAVPGLLLMARQGLHREAVICALIGIVLIVAISSYWGWNGGRVEGPRYLVPAIPFLAFPVAFFLDALPLNPLAWAIVAGTGGWSFFVVWAEFLGGYLFPISWLRDPIPQYSIPALRQDIIAPNAGFFVGLSGWESLLPLACLLVGVAFLTRRTTRARRTVTVTQFS